MILTDAALLSTDRTDQLPAPTAAKTMAIIEAVAQRSGGMTQAEIVEETGCSSNLVYRVLSTLTALGYMIRSEEDRRYALTNRLLEACRPRVHDKSLVLCAQAALKRLRDRTRETVQLLIEVNGKIMVLEQLGGLEPLQVMGRVGMRVPMYSCAPGKAILAFLPENEREAWFKDREFKSFTPNTLASRALLEEELTQVVRCGYAEDREEGIKGIRCIAAPILDSRQVPVAALTMMAPVKRLPQRRFAEIGQWCLEAAAEVREQLLA